MYFSILSNVLIKQLILISNDFYLKKKKTKETLRLILIKILSR